MPLPWARATLGSRVSVTNRTIWTWPSQVVSRWLICRVPVRWRSSGSTMISVSFGGTTSLPLEASSARWWVNSYSTTYNHMHFTFDGQTTGLGMADLLMGSVGTFELGTNGDQHKRASSTSASMAATRGRSTPRVTLSYGVRWEPYFPLVNLDGSAIHFDLDGMRKGIRSNRFTNSPPGVFFSGDPGVPGQSGLYKQWPNFSPRLGLAWDVEGNGRTSVRFSGGTFYDYPSTYYMTALTNAPPWNPRFTRFNVRAEDPWATEPGGDPFPISYG